MIKTTPTEFIDGIPADVRIWPEFDEIFYDEEKMQPAKNYIKTIIPFMSKRGFELLKEHSCLLWDGTFPTSKLSTQFFFVL